MKAAILIVVLFISASVVSAAVCRVTTTDDHFDQTCNTADCSLREAIVEPSCTVINFSLETAGYPILLTHGELAISRNLAIIGFGADTNTISGGHAGRIFFISAGASVYIAGLTLKDGNGVGTAPVSGGAIRSLGTLTLDSVHFTGNTLDGCASNCYGAAVAIAAGGSHYVQNSTFSGNTAPGESGVLTPVPGANATVFVYNSTLADNQGEAMFVTGNNVRMVNSTVNGLYVQRGMANLDISNSIVQDICRCSLLGGGCQPRQ
jgi:CSLREA domain-containing protein